MTRILACLLGALLLTGCGRQERRDVLLADYDFEVGRPGVFDKNWGWQGHLHWFGAGFSGPQGKGIWTLGEVARIHLQSAGERLQLELDLSTSPELSSGGQRLTVAWNGEALGEFAVGGGWKWQTIVMPVPAALVGEGLNEVTLRPAQVDGGRDDRPLGIFVRRLRLVASLDPDQEVAFRSLTAAEPIPDLELMTAPPGLVGRLGDDDYGDNRPDVMIVLLDAARADHFSCYGYGRKTSPQVDAVAAGAVTLRNVYAEASYTLASVPSLMTGRNPRDHGVLTTGRALSESQWTMAELFRAAGYLTLGWTDNPYVSGATKLDQGFDEWSEAWSHPLRDETRDRLSEVEKRHEDFRLPEVVEWLAVERFAQDLGDGPVFSYVHIMPPHGPYVPGEDHDLFTDPEYDGEIDGSTAQYHELVNLRLPTEGADLAQLVGYYDGNIHRADASFGRIRDAWQALGRDREFLLIVLSDHGEAFGEHGRFGHLTTCYDEMIHVPTMLWPKEAWSGAAGLADAHLTLADVTALILRRAQVGLPTGSVWPRRFLQVMGDPQTGGREQILMRSAPEHGQFAVRTDRWLALYDGLNTQGLFDLQADPGATRNLRLEDPDRYRRMINGLQATLEAGEAGETAVADLSDEDREALKAVGYL